MRIGAEREAEMPGISRPVIGLRLAAQHRFHHQRLFRRVGNILDHAVEQPRRNDLPQRHVLADGLEVIAQRDQLLARRRFVHAIHDRAGLAFERLGRRDIGRDHEILDHTVRVEAFAHGDFGNAALLVEHHPAFWQVEV